MAHDHDHTASDVSVFAVQLKAALESGELDAFGALLAEDVRWGGPEDTPDTCHSRADVIGRLARQRASGMQTSVLEVTAADNSALVGFKISHPAGGGARRQRTVFQVMTLRDGRISDIRGFPSRTDAAEHAGLMPRSARMHVESLVPILNVSSLPESFVWFEKLGWTRKWDWSSDGGEPAFGAVGSDNFEIWLSLNEQGGRGHDGVWLAIWTDNVDAIHDRCMREQIEVLRPPADESWGVREMHVRHPDGHVFRISQPIHHHHH